MLTKYNVVHFVDQGVKPQLHLCSVYFLLLSHFSLHFLVYYNCS